MNRVLKQAVCDVLSAQYHLHRVLFLYCEHIIILRQVRIRAQVFVFETFLPCVVRGSNIFSGLHNSLATDLPQLRLT